MEISPCLRAESKVTGLVLLGGGVDVGVGNYVAADVLVDEEEPGLCRSPAGGQGIEFSEGPLGGFQGDADGLIKVVFVIGFFDGLDDFGAFFLS